MEIKCPICGNHTKLDDKTCVSCGSSLQDIHKAFLRRNANAKSEDNSGYSASELDELFEFEKNGSGYAISEYYGLDSIVFIPGKYKGKVVNSILPNSFESSDVVEVYLPNSIKEIGHDSFNGCFKLEKIIIPDKCRYIGANAFCDCISLTNLFLPKNMVEIGPHAFSGCIELSKINLPDALDCINESLFENCTSLPYIIIPKKVKTIHSNAFANCSGITKIKFGDNLTSIREFAFGGCTSLIRALLPESLVTLGENVFYNCQSLKAVYLGKNLVEVNGSSFYGCNSLNAFKVNDKNPRFYTFGNSILSKISGSLVVGTNSTVIPDFTTNISSNAFCGYSFDGALYIPKTVISIDEEAIFNSSNFVINVEHNSKPSGWANNWLIGDNNVVWGVKKESAMSE